MEIYKVMTISAAHQLHLPYVSKCNNLHGHDYKVEFWINGELNDQGMVMDYNHLKAIGNKYDHQNLNKLMAEPSTAENFCLQLIQDILAVKEEVGSGHQIKSIKVRVSETPTTYAEQELILFMPHARLNIPKPPVETDDSE